MKHTTLYSPSFSAIQFQLYFIGLIFNYKHNPSIVGLLLLTSIVNVSNMSSYLLITFYINLTKIV